MPCGVGDLAGTVECGEVELSWINGTDYDEILIQRGSGRELIETLAGPHEAGAAMSYTDSVETGTLRDYWVTGVRHGSLSREMEVAEQDESNNSASMNFLVTDPTR